MAITMVDPKKKGKEKKLYSLYEDPKMLAIQAKQPDGIAPLVKPVVEGIAGAAGAVKSGSDAFSGVMINNPVAKGVSAITDKLSSDAQAQQVATDTYDRKKMREGLVKQFPEGRQLFSNMPVKPTAENSPELFAHGQTKDNASVPAQAGVMGVAAPATSAFSNVAESERVVPNVGLKNTTGELQVKDDLAKMNERIAAGFGSPEQVAKVKELRQMAGFKAGGTDRGALGPDGRPLMLGRPPTNPNIINSNTGIVTEFPAGTDPAVIARQRGISKQMDEAAKNPETQANYAAQREQLMARQPRGAVGPSGSVAPPVANTFGEAIVQNGLAKRAQRAQEMSNQFQLGRERNANDVANANLSARTQLGVAGIGARTAADRNAVDLANTEISRMNAESTGKVQAVDAEGKRFSLDKQKEVDALTKQRMTATPEEIIKIDSQLEAMGALKREKPTVHFAKTYDAQGMPNGEEPYVFDPRTMGVTKPGVGQQQAQRQAPPEALSDLKKNPKLKEQFKAKFGYLPEGF